MTDERAIPTGRCWCGCDAEISVRSFFKQGHDKTAESGVIMAEYGGVPEFLLKHGYGPGGKSARDALEASRSRGRR